jgi:hypothetical protein
MIRIFFTLFSVVIGLVFAYQCVSDSSANTLGRYVGIFVGIGIAIMAPIVIKWSFKQRPRRRLLQS